MEYIGSGIALILAVGYYNYRQNKKAAGAAAKAAGAAASAEAKATPEAKAEPVKGGGSKLRKNKSP
jgi:hypothetical protein